MTDAPPSTPPPPAYPPYPPYPPPPLVAAVPKLPRKWLGPKGGWLIFLVLTAFWGANLIFNAVILHTSGVSPNTMVLGGLGMTAGLLYTLAYRIRPHDGISPLRLVLAFVFGGLLATELAAWIELLVEVAPVGSLTAKDILVRSLAGVIEEACKLLAVVVFARGLTKRTAITGLFLGGAVGLGFAAFEDMKYAVTFFDHPQPGFSPIGSLLTITLGRDAIGPFEHPVFTALIAAALFAATRGGRFRLTPRVVVVYLLVALAHALVDAPYSIFLAVLHSRTGSAALAFLVAAGAVVTADIFWLRHARRLRREDDAAYASASPVGSTAVGSSSASPPTGSPFQ
jgi:RsiW-degrading membrane proteinase PrsW (M82 family)